MSAIVENAVGSLIASEVHGVIGMVLLRIKYEFKLAWYFRGELKELKDELTRISRMLEYVLVESVTNSIMADWLKKIKDAAFEADRLLDKWSYEELEQKIKGKEPATRKRDKVKQVAKNTAAAVFSPVRQLCKAHKLKDMRELLDEISILAQKNGIKPIEVAAGKVYGGEHFEKSEKQEETSLYYLRQCVNDKTLLGREEDISTLVNHLCNDTNNTRDLTVVGIYGFAGLGKTALSKRISTLEGVTEFFDAVIWIVISHKFDLLKILNDMVEILFKEASKMEVREALISKLQEKLNGKRYLLVLDDVWSTFCWEPLESTLLRIGGSKGTTLLVTSREDTVVKNIRYDGEAQNNLEPYVHELKGLGEDDSWSLLKTRLSDQLQAGSKKEEMAQTMIKHCGGVPLSIKTLRDLLIRDEREEKWEEIMKCEIWTKEDEHKIILPSLRLSYKYLPSMALKKCFSYCAIYKEGEVINKAKLIYKWMAQGFLQPYDNMASVGEEFLQPYDNMTSLGEKYVKFLLSSSLFHEPTMDKLGNIETFKMHDLVCTLARDVSKGEKWGSRVSNIGENWSPDTKGQLFDNFQHIRYLELSVDHLENAESTFLPEQITELYHLQTLWINSKSDPESIKKPCIRLPDTIGNLVNLRHIHIDGYSIGIPKGLCHLTALCALPVVNLGIDWGGSFSEVGSLNNLKGKLGFRKLTCITDEAAARSLKLGHKSNVDNLVLHWTEMGWATKNPKANEILEVLRPNAKLKMLEIWQYNGTRFPTWLVGGNSTLGNLVSLEIQKCAAEGYIKLENFRTLHFLTLSCCPSLTITFPNKGFECCKFLEKLEIVYCRGVETFGERSDLSPLTQLRSLHIWGNVVKNAGALEGLGALPHLSKLCIDEYIIFEDFKKDSSICSSLQTLDLKRCDSDDHTETLPNQLQHLVALRCLSISGFEGLKMLPDWLGNMTSLRLLELRSLPDLEHLPSRDVMQRLSNLNTFDIRDCRLLTEDFDKQPQEWLEIANRIHVSLDHEPVTISYSSSGAI